MSRSFLGLSSPAMQKGIGRRQRERRGRLGQDVVLTGVCAAWRQCRCQHSENEQHCTTLLPHPYLPDMFFEANTKRKIFNAKVSLKRPNLACMVFPDEKEFGAKANSPYKTNIQSFELTRWYTLVTWLDKLLGSGKIGEKKEFQQRLSEIS